MQEVDLRHYISQYASFYLLGMTGNPSYVGHILDQVHSYLEVSMGVPS